MEKFIEIFADDGTIAMFNISKIKVVLKDEEGKAVICMENNKSISTTMEYEIIKNILIPSNESIYNNPNVEFSC